MKIQLSGSVASVLILPTAAALLLALVACGGGGGGDGEEGQMQLAFTIPSTAELDGVAFGDSIGEEGHPEGQPSVGDGRFIAANGPSRFVSYFSFDLSALPAGATIRTATLSLFNRETLGDPDGMMGFVRVDHVEFGSVFPQVVLGGTPLDLNFALIDDIGTLGRKTVDVATQVQADIDAGRSRSQYRLRGALANNLDPVSDIAFLTDGEDSQGSGELPFLIIEIEAP